MYNQASQTTEETIMSPSKTLKTAAEKAVAAGLSEFSYGNNGTRYYVHNPTLGQQILKKVKTFFLIPVNGIEYKIYKAQG